MPSRSIHPLLTVAGLCLLGGLTFLRSGWLRSSLVLALVGFIAVGAATENLFPVRFPPNHVSHLEFIGGDLNDPIRLEGKLASTPTRTSYGLQFDVEAQRIESHKQVFNTRGKVRLRLQTSEDSEVFAVADSLHLQYGDSIRALARLRKPRIYQNPGSFDFRRWMESIEDITWVGTIRSPLLVEKLAGKSSFQPDDFFERLRHRMIEGIDRLYPSWTSQGRGGAVLKAVLLGDRSSLDSETIGNFRKTGLYHLLVIAGLHVGLLILLVNSFLRRFPIGDFPRWLLVLLFLVTYSLLVEQRAPTLRATVMITIYLLGRLLYRDHSALNAVGFAALILLLWRPAWLFESGFQLSFAAALLIAGLAVPILEQTIEPYRRALKGIGDVSRDDVFAPKQAQFRLDLRAAITWLNARFEFLSRHPAVADTLLTGPARLVLWAASMLLFSAVLQLGLLLPMAETFHRVTFAGIGLNALAIPIMTLLLAFALPTMVLSACVPALAVWPAKGLSLIMATLFNLTDLPQLPVWLSYRIPEPPEWVACGFAVSAVAAGFALQRWPRVLWLSLTALGIFTALISFNPFPPRLPTGQLEITALDCGQGDALFLVFPDRTTMLLDSGGNRLKSTTEGAFQGRQWDPGEDIVSPYLWSRGLKKIDILVLSHAHEDHLGGMAAIVRNFRIGEFWNGREAQIPAYRDLIAQVRQHRTPIRRLASGDLIKRGQTSVQILWPPQRNEVSQFPSNDDSLVMRIAHGASSILLPGDISGVVEQELVASRILLRSQILKVAHHGSKSSSSPVFIGRVAPLVALVTSESGGFVSLPSAETINRLRPLEFEPCEPTLTARPLWN